MFQIRLIIAARRDLTVLSVNEEVARTPSPYFKTPTRGVFNGL